MIFLFLIVTAAFRPAQPAVGDLITVDFQKPVILDSSPAYEIVSQNGKRVVVRTFEPKPFALSGVTDGVHFRNLIVPVRSVLQPKDKLEPAPLRPPVPLPYPREPLIALGIATAVAALSWLAVVLLARRRHEVVELVSRIAPADRFRAAVDSLRSDSSQPDRWAALADETRVYLAALSPYFGTELTSSQLLARVDAEHVAVVSQILRQGDLEKFSPWGAPRADFHSIATSALQLIPAPREEEAVAA